jgi:hypothetical protein
MSQMSSVRNKQKREILLAEANTLLADVAGISSAKKGKIVDSAESMKPRLA